VSIIDRARSWIAQDPDPETRRELEALIERGDMHALQERFTGTLQFGTAGIRGLLTRMNRVTVAQTTAGLCAWLKQEVPDIASRGICVGRDARVNSDVFERDVIEVAAGAGIPVWVFSDVVPTPVLAFAVLERRAGGGVMITASHNPPGYNGYKVYWENGAQIIPPNDLGIAGEIERAPAANQIPRLSIAEARARELARSADSSLDSYVERISIEASPLASRADVRIAYTALHGVAEDTFRKVLGRAGFEDVHSVADQAVPDGRFPTVAFPNPEEPGAMDHVLALAERVGADLAIANDPDGDRVAVAVRGGDGLELLSGNDTGILLADDLLRRHPKASKPLVISTVVSSPMLRPIAAAHGARWEQTLTGHKWIQNRALELEQEGFAYVFGYEEALGYAPCQAVRDKDGISSALLLVDMAARLKTRSETLLDARDALWREYGFFADRQISVRFEGTNAQTQMSSAVERLRQQPPREIGGQSVLAPSNVVIFELEGGHRAMLRPSGTEPKLKYYFYATAPVHACDNLAESKKQALEVLDRMTEDLTRSSNC